jgi:hypothetical protein
MIGKALTAVVVGLAVPAVADACRCREPSVDVALSRSQAVVLGRIAAVRDIDRMRTVLTIQVERSWKRPLGGRIEVDTGTTCRVPAVAGQRYLLFLRTGGQRYYSNRCMGDRLDPSVDTLRALDRHATK